MTLPLALSGDQLIALVGVSSGALVGIAGLVFAYFNGKSERDHAKQLARSGRLHEQRLTAYVEIGKLLRRHALFVERSGPGIPGVPRPDPPPPLDDEEWTSLMGRAAVSATQSVLIALEAASYFASAYASDIEHRSDDHHAIRVTRDRARDAISDAEREMREELADL